jgi:predicted SprT family Zn-dependent metalloprotease
MSSTDPTNTQFSAYRAMWDYFNGALFGGVLERVILNFSRHANSYGFFAPLRWKQDNSVTHEISLNPTYVTKGPNRGARDVAATLVHECVHLWQFQLGKPSRGGYHNDEWARKMEELGLQPSSTGQPGGKRVGYRVSHYIIEDGAFARAFAAMPPEYVLPWTCGVDESEIEKGARGGAGGTTGTGTTGPQPGAAPAKKVSKLKYTCPKCKANVWGKPGLRLRCDVCDQPFRCATESADAEADDDDASDSVREAA